MNLHLNGRTRLILISAGVVMIVLLIAASLFAVRLQPMAKRVLIESLRDRYKADVEVGDLRISLLPLVRVSGENLTMKLAGGTQLLKIGRFSGSASVFGLLRTPRHISSVNLEGLDIKIPPKGAAAGSSKPAKISLVLDDITADGTHLQTTPKDPSKDPLDFQIHKLRMHNVGAEDALSYHAELTNPKPRGLIVSDGTFGPWDADEPTNSPLQGSYTFHDADLSIFKGIGGKLESKGQFKGRLDTIEVQGAADVPDFSLRLAGHSMPLHTEFQATVDGTDGDTILHPVKARLGKSTFEVSGAIDKGSMEAKKTILLETRSDSSRIEDFLELAMKGSKPAMVGPVRFRSTVKIPPGDSEVIDRLELDGEFGLGRVTFTNPEIQGKISNLSHRAEGEPEDKSPNVAAAFSGHFVLRDGVMHLPDIAFQVPGAVIAMAGNYRMRGGALDFHGTAKLQATISEMTTGVKKILLKPIDPLFKRSDAGAVVPIRISGTPGQPSFMFDIGRALRGK